GQASAGSVVERKPKTPASERLSPKLTTDEKPLAIAEDAASVRANAVNKIFIGLPPSARLSRDCKRSRSGGARASCVDNRALADRPNITGAAGFAACLQTSLTKICAYGAWGM